MRHPLRWLRNNALLAIDGLALVHVGTLIVVALYYLAFQTIPGVKYDWDHALTGGLHFWGLHVHLALLSKAHWAQWRHLIRNVGEGLLGGVLGQAIIWNHFKVKPRPRNWIDELEIALHIPNLKDDRRTSGWQMLALPLLVLVYAIPGFAIGAGVAHLIQHGLAHVHLHQVSSDAGRPEPVDQQRVAEGRRSVRLVRVRPPRRPRGLRRRAAVLRRAPARRGKPLAAYHRLVPTFAARYNSVSAEEAAPGAAGSRHDRWATLDCSSRRSPLGIGLAAFGYYVLAYIATGKT